MKMFANISRELAGFSSREKKFLLAVMLCGFCISAEYSVTRPASTSIFLTTFSVKLYPYAWLLTVPLNFLVIYLYNRFLPKLGCLKTLFTIAAAATSVNVLFAYLLPHWPELSFFHFMWKDIYILLMFKQLWSLIHMTISSSRAKYLYGLIFGMGGVGSVVGSLIPGFMSVKMGSANLFFLTLPIYSIAFAAYYFAWKRSEITNASFQKVDPRPKEAFSLIRKSRFLAFILFLVILMQVTTALTDYQFNVYLERSISDLDLRTQYYGRLGSIISSVTVAVQFLGAFLFMHFMGLRNTHLFVPALFLSNAALFSLFPSFGMISYQYVSIKAIDFSLFGIIREVLYSPMKLDEKFRAKAVIDVFAYRSAKALASFMLLFFQFAFASLILPMITGLTMVLFFGWIVVVYRMFRTEELVTLNSTI